MAREFDADIAVVQRIEAIPRILEVVCRMTGMGFAAVARVTEDRWIACAVRDEIDFGLRTGGELTVETTICHEIRQSGKAVVIDHVAEDAAFCRHPTPAMYGFQSYISMPIVLPNGDFFGTLCAIDPKPVRVNTTETIGMFRLFAELIAIHIDIETRLQSSEASLAISEANLASSRADLASSRARLMFTETSLAGERETSDLREQFLAVLGHDLRNPLASIAAGARLLKNTPLNVKAVEIVEMIVKSVGRMSDLIDNVLDFASGRLGGGLILNTTTDEPLQPILEHVVAELRASYPDRPIHPDFHLTATCRCDRARIAQLLSNLLGNALKYGAPGTPVQVRATTTGNVFELAVANRGEPIPAAVMQGLFQPFTRGKVRANQQGLGLGLYIASEIARAHGGKIDVVSNVEETRFTFRMPLA